MATLSLSPDRSAILARCVEIARISWLLRAAAVATAAAQRHVHAARRRWRRCPRGRCPMEAFASEVTIPPEFRGRVVPLMGEAVITEAYRVPSGGSVVAAVAEPIV